MAVTLASERFDVGGGLGPARRFGILVPAIEPAHDRLFELPGAVETAAPNGLGSNQGEPAFDQIEPRSAGRSEVEVKPQMSGQPAFDRRMFMGAVVVTYQMQLQLRITSCQRLQKGDDVPMATVAASVDLSAGHLQRGEQAGGAVASVIMGHAGGQPRPHWQRRLSAVKRLDLRFFVHTQDQRALGWVEIEPDDIDQFEVELGVAAELESLMRQRNC